MYVFAFKRSTTLLKERCVHFLSSSLQLMKLRHLLLHHRLLIITEHQRPVNLTFKAFGAVQVNVSAASGDVLDVGSNVVLVFGCACNNFG